jgi:hypothetical protein
MDKLKIVLLAFGLSLIVGACADRGHDPTMAEPAAGPAGTAEDPGLTRQPDGGTMESDDQEGAGGSGGSGSSTQ